MKIGIANDHSAVDMKNEIVAYLESQGYEVVNYGTDIWQNRMFYGRVLCRDENRRMVWCILSI